MERIHALGLSTLLALSGCEGAPPGPTADSTGTPSAEAAALAAVQRGDTGALKAWGGALVLPEWVPVEGRSLDAWTVQWWRWISAIPASQSPEFNLALCDVDQPAGVFFLPPFQGASYTRSCTIPFGKPVLVEAQAVVNDYPCPDPTFQPAPGQTLAAFLTEGAVGFDDAFPLLALEVDGHAVQISRHRDTSQLFEFKADESLVGPNLDPCLTGTLQPGVSDGWWAFLLLAPGEHTVIATTTNPGGGDAFVHTFQLQVSAPGR
jgi:hypothetical protein